MQFINKKCIFVRRKYVIMVAINVRKTKKRVILSISQTALENVPMKRILEWLRLEMLAQEVNFNEMALDEVEKEVKDSFWDSIKHRFDTLESASQ
jgi:hypothetical protein